MFLSVVIAFPFQTLTVASPYVPLHEGLVINCVLFSLCSWEFFSLSSKPVLLLLGPSSVVLYHSHPFCLHAFLLWSSVSLHTLSLIYYLSHQFQQLLFFRLLKRSSTGLNFKFAPIYILVIEFLSFIIHMLPDSFLLMSFLL